MLLAHGATAVGGIVTARALGPDGKGVVAAVLAWPQLFGWLLLIGLGAATSLRVAERHDEALPDALGNALVYCLTVGLVGVGVGLTLLPAALDHLGPSAAAAARLALVAIPISMLGEVLMGINLALGRTKRYNTARIGGGVTILVLSIALVAIGRATPETVVGAALIGGLFTIGLAGGGLPWRSLRVALGRLRSDLAYGAKVFLTSLLGLVNLRLDILLMTVFLGASEIGWYTIAVGVMLPITVVTTAASSLIMPAIGRRRSSPGGSGSVDVALIRRTALRYSLLTLAMAVGVAALVPWGLPLVFGQPFAPAVALAWILLPGFVAQGYAYIVNAGMVGMRKPWVGNVSQGCGVIFTAAMLPILLPRYGATGAAITSSVAYTASACMAIWALGRVGRNPPPPAVAPDAISVPDASDDAIVVRL